MDEKRLTRFWEQVDRTGECWEWTGERTVLGYGRAWDGNRPWYAHRLSWAIANSDPGEQCVLHRCDNPPCIRPEHLFLGDRTANRRDCTAKGRSAAGSKNGQAKLTESAVLAIREMRRDTGAPFAVIGPRFGISAAQACRIANGTSRKTG